MNTIIFLMAMLAPVSPTNNKPVTQQVEKIYTQFLTCSEDYNTRCRSYTSELISTVYGIDNLKNSSGYMSTNQLAQHIENSDDWSLLGPGYKTEVLQTAQEKANNEKAVVAVYVDELGQLMHVAVILPGEMTPSGTWGMPVPNSVSLALYDSDHSFINKGLSYAFKKHMLLRVKIYAFS